MHPCLNIPEIVLQICNQVTDAESSDTSSLSEETMVRDFDAMGHQRPQSCSSQLYALARTCRQLQGPALQTLWRTLDAIEPILGLAGCDVLDIKEDYLCLVRPIYSAEAITMKKYASLVRHLCLDKPYRIDESVWNGLRDVFQGTALFTNLTTMVLDNGILTFNSLFATQSLTSLIVCGTIIQHLLLEEFFTRCKGLKLLRICPAMTEGVSQALVDALPNSPNLSQLALAATTTEVSQALSCCQRLQSIRIECLDYNIDGLSEVGTYIVFPMLGGFKVERGTMTSITRFLDALPAIVNLQTVSIYSNAHPISEEDEWLSLLRSLKKHSRSLSSLDVKHETHTSYPGDTALPDGLFTVLATYFTALTQIKIEYSGDFSFDDEGVKALTEALPLLEDVHFSLYSVFTEIFHHRPRTTFKCLMHFAQNCPRLSRLCISFDARSNNILNYLEPTTQGLKLTLLDVSVSPGGSYIADKVAEFILGIFPNIQRIDWEKYNTKPQRPHVAEGYHAQRIQLWPRVSRALERKKRKGT